MTAPLLGCTDRRQWISVLLTEPDLFGTDLADTRKHCRHREERSDVAIQGRRTCQAPWIATPPRGGSR